eukprot:365377-Chlamydomonas_euryale.AAC.19
MACQPSRLPSWQTLHNTYITSVGQLHGTVASNSEQNLRILLKLTMSEQLRGALAQAGREVWIVFVRGVRQTLPGQQRFLPQRAVLDTQYNLAAATCGLEGASALSQAAGAEGLPQARVQRCATLSLGGGPQPVHFGEHAEADTPRAPDARHARPMNYHRHMTGVKHAARGLRVAARGCACVSTQLRPCHSSGPTLPPADGLGCRAGAVAQPRTRRSVNRR